MPGGMGDTRFSSSLVTRLGSKEGMELGRMQRLGTRTSVTTINGPIVKNKL